MSDFHSVSFPGESADYRAARNALLAEEMELLVNAVLEGQLPAGEALPSCRKMAKILGVSRNTVVLAYQGLVDDGYLVARERSGFYVNPDILDGHLGKQSDGELPAEAPIASIVELLIGAIVLRIVARSDADDGEAERLVDIVLGRYAPGRE